MIPQRTVAASAGAPARCPVETRAQRRAGVTDVLDVLDIDVVAHDDLLARLNVLSAGGSAPALPSATPSHSAANVAHLGPGVKGRGLVVRSRTEGPLRDSSGEPGCDTAPAALVMFAPDTVCADYGGLRGADEARRAWPALPPELRCRQA